MSCYRDKRGSLERRSAAEKSPRCMTCGQPLRVITRKVEPGIASDVRYEHAGPRYGVDPDIKHMKMPT